MPIPTYDKMLQPLLALAARQDLTRRVAESAMAEYFALTTDEKVQRIPSKASTVVGNRSGWAMTFLTKAGLIAKVAPKTYRATEAGSVFLMAHPDSITVRDLEAIDGWEDAWQTKRKNVAEGTTPDSDDTSATPAEAIDAGLMALNADVRSRLLDALLKQSPEFFERLVLDVLIKMGYGGSREDAAQHMGRSGDEGIDGRINQDALGLDQILVQAKRYTPANTIDRKTIQAFIGSLAGQGVSKGIFITTSSFADSAREFVQRGAQTKIVLIDGNDLLDLMLRHHVGVRVERAIELLDLDQNYFEDGE